MRRTISRKRLVLLGLLCVFCSGASRSRHDSSELPKANPLAWPSPPQSARVRFVQAVSRAEDLGIRKPAWKRLIDAIAGSERADHFIRPTGIAAAGALLYVADPGSGSLWVFDLNIRQGRRISKAGKEKLVSPVSVAANPAGGVYLADSYLAKVFYYDAKKRLTRTIAAPGMLRPAGVAYDGARDRLYVADSAAHRVWVFTGNGNSVASFGKRGTAEGEFNYPTHLALDKGGALYVTDALGFRVQAFSAEGSFVKAFGRHGDGSGDFASPKGIALDSAGHLYVADALFDRVQIFDGKDQLLLAFGQRGMGLGEFSLPNGICIDAKDRIYVADSYNHRIQLFDYVAGDVNG